MTSGLLFDSYPVGNVMVSWIRDGDSITRITDDWTPPIYAACENRQDLDRLACSKKILPHVMSAQMVEKFEKVTDRTRSHVLQLKLRDSNSATVLAKTIESLTGHGRYRLYNVDIPPAQAYFYEKDIFPFGNFTKGKTWQADDDIESADYEIPNLGMINLKAVPRKEHRLARFTDRIGSITLGDDTIQSKDEAETILQLADAIRKQDPDIIITENGDTFDLPYLAHRAKENGISGRLVLGREGVPLQVPRNAGTSFFSYGRMYFKPSAARLLGRIHIDTSGCFIWNSSDDLQGLYEIARVCRMPMQTAARASIGKCMSSVQFYNATRRGLLIPWKPVMAEAFKPRTELLVGDRGGLIFEPQVGTFENVAELDFASLYGTIMEKKNISAETILCRCCPDSENRVPELGYNICRYEGIVPQSLHILLKKRPLYTDLLARPENKKAAIHTARKSALKWILVTSFGYLGFNNAKFGRIDAHMAVCAFARQILVRAVRIAEKNGFCVLHGIVDSLWLYRGGATRKQYEAVRDEIVRETGFAMSLDIYKWLVLLTSKEDDAMPVANRYFGAFEGGEVKIRGIETRRHDTPAFFKQCQNEMLGIMAKAGSVSQIKEMIPEVVRVYERYKKTLEEGNVPAEYLSFTTRASRDVGDYVSSSVQRDAMEQLREEGELVRAGQKVRYVITDYSRKARRSAPLGMAGKKYDIKRYAKLLARCCNTVTVPFGTDVANKDCQAGSL